jgi:hypothetical protein
MSIVVGAAVGFAHNVHFPCIVSDYLRGSCCHYVMVAWKGALQKPPIATIGTTSLWQWQEGDQAEGILKTVTFPNRTTEPLTRWPELLVSAIPPPFY